MAKRVHVDPWLFATTIVLVFIGLVMVFSASAVTAGELYGSPYTFVFKQFIFATLGLIALWALMHIDYHKLDKPAIVFPLIGLTSLLLVLVLFLDRSHNTHRWLKFAGLSFQPSELAKLALVVFMAQFLSTRAKSMADARNTMLPAIAPCVVFCALIAAQPDLGTAMMCLAITGSILFVAGMPFRWFAFATLPLAPVLYYLIVLTPWRWKRMTVFMDPFSDAHGTGFQTIQSLIAVGTGGVTGQGLMEGKQKLFYLPEPHNDFIFAVTAEELGLVGSIFIVTLFAVFCWRGIRAAMKAPDPFGRFLATGITAMVGVQAFFNISVVLALLPTKGIPLPFMSYGGSSILLMLAGVGILLNVSRQAE